MPEVDVINLKCKTDCFVVINKGIFFSRLDKGGYGDVYCVRQGLEEVVSWVAGSRIVLPPVDFYGREEAIFLTEQGGICRYKEQFIGCGCNLPEFEINSF